LENIATIGGDHNLYFYWYQSDSGHFARELVDTSADL